MGTNAYVAIKKNIILIGGGHSMVGGGVLKKNRLQDFKKFVNSCFYKKFKQKQMVLSTKNSWI